MIGCAGARTAMLGLGVMNTTILTVDVNTDLALSAATIG